MKFFNNIKDINNFCKLNGIKNYTINEDLSIDVNGGVELDWMDFGYLPIKFKKVSGDFSISYCGLNTLEGCPEFVGGYFDCSFNYLTSLDFSPKVVERYFDCRSNSKLKTNYCETKLKGYFVTNKVEDGLIIKENIATNYNQWRKLIKRKSIINFIISK